MCHEKTGFLQMQSELSQDSVARLTCASPLNLFKFMTKDIDFNVTQVGHDGTAQNFRTISTNMQSST